MSDQDLKTNISVRLDKWLWAARFFRTRALAKQAIEGGKVHYNGQRSKVSKMVEIGAELRIRQGFDERDVIVKGLSDQRRGAPEAQMLYEETPDSIKRRMDAADKRKQFKDTNPMQAHRPNKKERRQIHRFKEEHQ